MAIYHFTVKMISRGKGQSGVGALAYRAGIKLHDQRIGKSFDYREKTVQHVEMLLPDHVPEFMKQWQEQLSKDRQGILQQFSDYLESFERRCDSRLYREIEFALPAELTNEQNTKLAKEFIEHHCVSRGMVAICNFHFDVDEVTGQFKPHCHALLSTRNITPEGFGLKNRDWERNDLVREWRERWCEYLNFALKNYGIDARVDHRSYADRGIELEPQLKKSHGMLKRVKQGLDSFRYAAFEDIRRRNLFKIQRRPELVLELVSQNQSTFTDKDILRVIGRYADSHTVFEEIRVRVFGSSDLVRLKDPKSPGDTDKEVYTTRSLIRLEAAIIAQGQRIAECKSHGVLTKHLIAAKAHADQELKEFGGLSLEQKSAIDHLVTPGRLKTLVGYAGSGKTTALKVAASAWKETGYQVLGLAPTGRASENLEELGIRAMTLDRYFKSFETGREQYGKGSVFILDEAGMVDSRKMSMLLDIVERQGIKLVLVGDKGQLQAVQAGPPFRMLLDRVNPAKLESIIRQRKDWQKDATKLFGQEKSKQALQLYRDKGHIKLINEQSPVLSKFRQGKKLTNAELIQAHLITRRIAGNIYYQIRSDLLHQGVPEEKVFNTSKKHPLFPLFQSWRKEREATKDSLQARRLEVVHSARGISLKVLEDHKGDLEAYRSLAKDDATFERWLAIQEVATSPEQQRSLELKSGVIDLRTKTKQRMVGDWLNGQQEHTDNPPSSLMLAHSNKDVDDLNRMVRAKLKQLGDVAQEEVTISVTKDVDVGIHGTFEQRRTKREYENINFAVGDQVIFKKNEYGMGVKNGTLGIITAIDNRKVKVMLKGVDTREVSFAPALYPYFRHGWAVTLNAAQGTTVDDVKMLASFEQARNLSYVGFTRHRDSFQIYGSELEFNNQALLVDRLSRSHEKLTAVDYRIEPEQLEKVLKQDERLITRAWKKYERAKDTVNAGIHFAKNLFNEPEEINSTFGDGSQSEPERAIKVLGIDGNDTDELVPAHLLNKQKEATHQEQLALHASQDRRHEPTRQTQAEQNRLALRQEQKSSRGYYDINVLNDLIKGNEEQLLTNLLGQKPNSSLTTSQEFRFGNKGSFVFKREGSQSGLWHDFEADEGGNIYSLIKRHRGLDQFKDQLKYVAEFYGVAPTQTLQKQTTLSEQEELAKAQRQIAQETQKKKAEHEKRRHIETMYKKSHSLSWTVAERYLEEQRGLTGPFPDSLRYVENYQNGDYRGPALVGFARDQNGDLCARQSISLDPATGGKANITSHKKSYGQVKGHPIVVKPVEASPKTIFVAEGIETALSIAEAVPESAEVWASLGTSNFKHLPVKHGQTLVICADNDGKDSKTEKTVAKAVLELKDRGLEVHVVQPKQQGYDFNDVLIHEGKEAVRNALEALGKVVGENIKTEQPLDPDQTKEEKIAIPEGAVKSSATFDLPATEYLRLLIHFDAHQKMPEGLDETYAYKNLIQDLKQRFDQKEQDKWGMVPSKEEDQQHVEYAKKAAEYLSCHHIRAKENATLKDLDLYCNRAEFEGQRTEEHRQYRLDQLSETREPRIEDYLQTQIEAERIATIEGRHYEQWLRNEKNDGKELDYSDQFEETALSEYKQNKRQLNDAVARSNQPPQKDAAHIRLVSKLEMHYQEKYGTEPTPEQKRQFEQIANLVQKRDQSLDDQLKNLPEQKARITKEFVQFYEQRALARSVTVDDKLPTQQQLNVIQKQAQLKLNHDLQRAHHHLAQDLDRGRGLEL